MAPLPVEILRGVYLGILTGIIPALAAWGLGFLFKYLTGVSIPGFGVVVLALALAGVNGGLLALTDPTIQESANATAVLVAIVVVLMLSLYAHAKGDAMGATFPKHVSLSRLRERTLSADVVELVGGRGQVRVEVVGPVTDIEGYPPVPVDVRAAIQAGEWTFPGDLPLAELESRLAERLRTEFDLTDVAVSIDQQGRATVAAAPPISGLSKRVPAGERAVSVDCLVPTGVARGDVVTVVAADTKVEGTVVSARSGGGPLIDSEPDGGTPGLPDDEPISPSSTTVGGQGRLTVTIPQSDVDVLLAATEPSIVVRARGKRREFELVSLLRRAGKRFQKLTLRENGALDGVTLRDADVREAYGVAILAVRRPDGWVLAPRGDTALESGDAVFAVGSRDALDAFAGAVS